MADLNGLKPYIKQQAEKLIDVANKRIVGGKYKVIITQGYRSLAEQDALFAQGRTVKTDKNGKKLSIVTNAKGGQSMHNFGLAIDFALATLDGKKVSWDTKADFDKDGKADWMEVVEEAKKQNFEWGGDWDSFTDMPHFQMLGGLTEQEIRNGKTPKFPSLDGNKVSSKSTVKLASTTSKSTKLVYTRLLKKGVSGTDVKLLQSALTKLGYKCTADGILGNGTELKIKAFQKKYKLEADGLVGKATITKINNLL